VTIEAAARQRYGVMREFLDSLPAYSLEVDRSFEEVQDDRGRKVFLAEVGKIQIARPNHVRSRFMCDRGDSELCYDGQAVHIFHALRNAWVELPLTGNLMNFVDVMAERFNVALPMADLLIAESRQLDFEGAERADYLGLHLVDNERCHHLAMIQAKVDWQLWIDAGEYPWPRKLVIVYKSDPGSPLSLAVFRNWIANPPYDEDTFRYAPPEGAQKIELT
jgi:hypothetical protein